MQHLFDLSTMLYDVVVKTDIIRVLVSGSFQRWRETPFEGNMIPNTPGSQLFSRFTQIYIPDIVICHNLQRNSSPAANIHENMHMNSSKGGLFCKFSIKKLKKKYKYICHIMPSPKIYFAICHGNCQWQNWWRQNGRILPTTFHVTLGSSSSSRLQVISTNYA